MKLNYCYQTKNFNERPNNGPIDTIIIHSTNRNFAVSLDLLTNPSDNPVSCHYLIDFDGTVYELLSCDLRAWHAGISYWQGRERINDFSIGIEIVNYDTLSYTEEQICSCINLCHHLMGQYQILPHNILAHSDIAPYRKTDPDNRFPWHRLAAENIIPSMLTQRKTSLTDTDKNLTKNNVSKNNLNGSEQDCTKYPSSYYIDCLARIGYDTRPLKNQPEKLPLLIASFQRRHCPNNITEIMDDITQIAIINVLKAID